MLRVVLTLVLIAVGGLAFAQETTTNAVVTPAPVVEAKKYPDVIKFSGITRLHYDVSFISNGNPTNQKWGNFNFWFLTLKAQADLLENLKAETSIDMGYFAGQRGNGPGSATPSGYKLLIDNLIETAFLQYKVFTPLVISAGRLWEFYAPWVYSQKTRDGISLTGSILDGMLKYGVQVFDDSVLASQYMPLMEAQIGFMPMKGMSLDLAAYIAGNPGLVTNTLQNGYSANLKVVKWSVLPDLFLMDEFVYNTVSVSNTATGVFTTNNSYNNFLTAGWQIGTILPFFELYVGDKNTDTNFTNDTDIELRLAAKWDISPNFAVVPYIFYKFIKDGQTALEPLAIRLRVDIKF